MATWQWPHQVSMPRKQGPVFRAGHTAGSENPLHAPSLAVVPGEGDPEGQLHPQRPGPPRLGDGPVSRSRSVFPSLGMRDFGHHHENVL